MLRVLTLSTLFPNAAEPTFGVFVEGQTLRLAAQPDVRLRVVNPLPRPPFPLSLHGRYRKRRGLAAEERWKDVPVSRPRFLMLPRVSVAWNPAAIVRSVQPIIAGLLRAGEGFDVIDAQFFYPDGPAAARLAEIFGLPFSIKARGADIHYWGAQPECRRMMLEAAERAGGLLAVAGSLRDDMIRLGMQGDKIAVHYTGVDLAAFRPADRVAAKAALNSSGKLVVSLGALIARKGHGLVIEAVAALPEVSLLVIGEGPERPALERLVVRLGLSDRVRLLGSVPHAKLPAILAAADVMALASRSEGLANAWVEAMACGTPVVTADVDGAREALHAPAAGRIVSERSPAAFAAAIGELLAAPLAQDAVRACAERFTWERNTQLLHQHLSRVARFKAPGGGSR